MPKKNNLENKQRLLMNERSYFRVIFTSQRPRRTDGWQGILEFSDSHQ